MPTQNKAHVEEKETIPAAAWQQDGKVDIVVQPSSPSVSSPRLPGNRKWARKVD